jgi:hypothetical protein
LQSIPRKEWLGKRIIAGLNQYFLRRQVFHCVAEKVVKLCAFRREKGVDLVVSTGDAHLCANNRAGQFSVGTFIDAFAGVGPEIFCTGRPASRGPWAAAGPTRRPRLFD